MHHKRWASSRMRLSLFGKLHLPYIFGAMCCFCFLAVIVTHAFLSGPEGRPESGFIPKPESVDSDHHGAHHKAAQKLLHIDKDLTSNISRLFLSPNQAFPERHVRSTGVHKPNTSSCGHLDRPTVTSVDSDMWHPVDSGSRSHFVFSAYVDTRTNPHSVRVIGVSEFRGNLFCQIWYKERSTPHVTSAVHNIVPETHGLKYGAALYTCSTLLAGTPYAVSVTSSKCGTPTHFLSVTSAPAGNKRTFTVCVSPINFHYDDIHSFVEMMEMNKIFGADKVVLYNHTTGWRVDRYIRNYVREGYADVMPWRIPLAVNVKPPAAPVDPEIHYFGQLAALNDCLYRYMHQTEYIIFTDLDELIVPRVKTTWREMLLNMTPTIKPGHGAYLFRNAFFRIDWPDDKTYDRSLDAKMQLRTQLKLNREDRIWDYYSRTKSMIRPHTVVMTGIHFMFQFISSTVGHFQVPKEVALLHHYRDWGDEEGLPERVFDPYMLKYHEQLIRLVANRHQISNGSM